LARLVWEPAVVVQTALSLAEELLKAVLRIFLRGDLDLPSISFLQIGEIRSVGKLVLGEGEKGASFDLRLAEKRRQESTLIGTAEIDAAGGNTLRDLLAKEFQELGVHLAVELRNTQGFHQRLANAHEILEKLRFELRAARLSKAQRMFSGVGCGVPFRALCASEEILNQFGDGASGILGYGFNLGALLGKEGSELGIARLVFDSRKRTGSA
jgi:hypothetical protein